MVSMVRRRAASIAMSVMPIDEDDDLEEGDAVALLLDSQHGNDKAGTQHRANGHEGYNGRPRCGCAP
jgi:hypothetical protein